MQIIDPDNIDWHGMEQRLHNIEDALITMQTVLNLLLDLLAQAIPPTEEDPDSGTSEGDA
jgi:hypothetical protein